jgi:anaerobic magnesium-protoporphyrin IX monomethyl ester cyclase
VNYQFYRDLLAGKYDAEINRGLDTGARGADLYQGTLVKA